MLSPHEQILENLRLIQMSHRQDGRGDHPALSEPDFLALKMKPFAKYEQTNRPMSALMRILTNPYDTAEELKNNLEQWLKVFSPEYQFIFPNEVRAHTNVDGFIDESFYFNSLKHKKIPLGEFHDLYNHSISLTDSRFVQTLDRLLELAGQTMEPDRQAVVNRVWMDLAERFPLMTEIDGRQALIPFGGYATISHYLPQTPSLHSIIAVGMRSRVSKPFLNQVTSYYQLSPSAVFEQFFGNNAPALLETRINLEITKIDSSCHTPECLPFALADAVNDPKNPLSIFQRENFLNFVDTAIESLRLNF